MAPTNDTATQPGASNSTPTNSAVAAATPRAPGIAINQQAAPVQQSAPLPPAAPLTGGHHSFKLTPFTPQQAAYWVGLAERAFTLHGITCERRKMLEITIALNQELRALTQHIAEDDTASAYLRLLAYLRRYGAKSQVEQDRAMLASRPLGDKRPSEHLHSLRVEFGTRPDRLPLLRRIFEDSLHPSIAALLAVENIADIDEYADKADELYRLYPPATVALSQTAPPAATAAAVINTSHDSQLLQALQALTDKVGDLSVRINQVEQRPTTIKKIKQSQPQQQLHQQPLQQYSQPLQQYQQHHQQQQQQHQGTLQYHNSTNQQYQQPRPQQQRQFQQIQPQPRWHNNSNNQQHIRGQQFKQPRPNYQQQQPALPAPVNSSNQEHNNWCRYHQAWGTTARNCLPPCAFHQEQSCINYIVELPGN